MKKIKNLTILAVAIMLLFSTTACEKEKVLTDSEIPTEIEAFVATHFPDNMIIQVVADIDGFNKTYDVILYDNIRLEFSRKKKIIEIESVQELPASVIPEKIGLYVESNFPDNVITKWELEDRHQQVGLDNGLDLEFSMQGDFLRIDD